MTHIVLLSTLCTGCFFAANSMPGDNMPWRKEEKWKNFSLSANSGKNLQSIWAATIIFSIITALLVFFTLYDPQSPPIISAFAAIFGLGIIYMIGKSIYATVQYLKYGEPSFLISQVPFALGGEMEGILMVEKRIQSQDGVIATLQCIKQTKDHKNQLHEKVLFEVFDMFSGNKASSDSDRTTLKVKLPIPTDQPERQTTTYPKILWRVLFKAETPGADFAADFDLPVYQVEDPSLIRKRGN